MFKTKCNKIKITSFQIHFYNRIITNNKYNIIFDKYVKIKCKHTFAGYK